MAMFTTVAAGIGLAATAATTGMSFVQAGKQKRAMQQAERDADEAMQEARKKLEINVYDKLAINKEPFELQREAMLAQGAQAIQAGVESERGAAAMAGRVQMAQQEGQAGIRTAMGDELQKLEMLSAQEEGRLRDIGVQLDLEEVAGAQLAAANAQELSAQAMHQGFEGVTSLGSQLAEKAPLFEKGSAGRQFNRMESLGMKNNELSGADIQNKVASAGTVGKTDFSGVGEMTREQYVNFMRNASPVDLRTLRRDQLGIYGFNPFRGSQKTGN